MLVDEEILFIGEICGEIFGALGDNGYLCVTKHNKMTLKGKAFITTETKTLLFNSNLYRIETDMFEFVLKGDNVLGMLLKMVDLKQFTSVELTITND